jgi:hypothetical protein
LVPSWRITYLLQRVRPFQVPFANLFLVRFFLRPCSTHGPSWLRP